MARANGRNLPPPELELPLPGRTQPPVTARSPAEPASPTSAAPARKPERRRRVLVVEDSADYLNIVGLLLRGDGLDVVEACDGREGLQLAVRHKPDLVILDFNMPRMNGFELLRALRAVDELRRVPVILFTGSPQRRNLREMNLDVEAFLDKPVPNKVLLEHVRELLARLSQTPIAPPPSPSPAEPALPAAAPPPAEESAEERSGPRTAQPAALHVVLPPPGTPMTLSAQPPAPASPEEPPSSHPPPLLLPPLPNGPSPVSGPPEPEELLEAGDLVDSRDEAQEQRRLERERSIEARLRDSPLVRRVHQLLLQAVRRRASDIHIERQEGYVAVRFRIDGSLVEVCMLPASIHPRLVTRVKIMANLVITEHRLPQDGQFQVDIRGQRVQFRVSTLPSTYGESLVLRALSSGGVSPDLGKLGLEPRDLEVVGRTLRRPHGLVLVTGPTGSGKTSTLYSMLAALNKPNVKILTAEDPIEYRLAGITQVQVRPDIGLKFETALRAFLRQDPDVMLIGEIRDLETADIAAKAAITGHLVLSTLHTNSAPASLARLAHIGLQSYLLAASVKLIIAQRLVRRLCPGCKAPADLTDDDRRALSEREQEAVAGAMRASGCQQCAGTGFRGRMPVFEVMEVRSAAIRETIQQSPAVDRIAEVALREGMTPLRQATLRAVAAGQTSLNEAYKVIFSE